MRKTIVRTITQTKICSVVIEPQTDGTILPVGKEPIFVNGKLQLDKALEVARKTYGMNVVVTSTHVDEGTYEISVDDFLKYATKVEPKDGVVNAD